MTEAKPSKSGLDIEKCKNSFFNQLGRLSAMCDQLLVQAREASDQVDAHSELEAVNNVLSNSSKMIIQVAYLKSHALLWRMASEAEAEKLEESVRTGQS